MRVLSSVVDPRMGGPQRRSLDVANELAHRGIETVFLIPEGDNEFHKMTRTNGFETYRVCLPRIRALPKLRENSKFLITFLPTTRQIATILEEVQLDIVHANMALNFQTAMAAARCDTPLAWHFNDTMVPTPIRQLSAVLGRQWADEIVVAADAVHDYYFNDNTPSRTIYPPVDLDRFDPEKVAIDESARKADIGISDSDFVIGTIGNLNPVKGHDYLLNAIARLVDRGYDVTVPVVGSRLNSQEEYYRRLLTLRAELGLEDEVEFVGFRSDVPELLSLFDVFVLPSVAEACPIVVIEAMAMKCPVVATAVGGVTEELPGEGFGWLIPPEQPKAMADAIETVLEKPRERRRRVRNARHRVETTFSVEVCADRHETLYRSLIQ